MFDPRHVWQHSFMEIDNDDVFSMVIFSGTKPTQEKCR